MQGRRGSAVMVRPYSWADCSLTLAAPQFWRVRFRSARSPFLLQRTLRGERNCTACVYGAVTHLTKLRHRDHSLDNDLLILPSRFGRIAAHGVARPRLFSHFPIYIRSYDPTALRSTSMPRLIRRIFEQANVIYLLAH